MLGHLCFSFCFPENCAQPNSDNDIREEGAKALASALRINRVLKSINLEYKKLGDEGKGAIWDAVSGRVGFVVRAQDMSVNSESEQMHSLMTSHPTTASVGTT